MASQRGRRLPGWGGLGRQGQFLGTVVGDHHIGGRRGISERYVRTRFHNAVKNVRVFKARAMGETVDFVLLRRQTHEGSVPP